VNKLENIYHDNDTAAAFAKAYLDYLSELLGQLDVQAIDDFANTLLAARNRGSRIFFIGNGGSAATASHFANDIGIGTRSWRRPFRAVSLTDNLAILTAIANDDGYDQIFTQQLQTQMCPGDVVVAISASGNSPNVVKAVEYANSRGGITVGLSGFDGGQLRRISHVSVHVPCGRGEYGPAEDVHMILDHLVGAFLINVCREEKQQSEAAPQVVSEAVSG
jgi:D-sedoheptulose 7-phosphate isomerase